MKLHDISFKVILIGIAIIAILLLLFIAGNYQYLLKNPLTSTKRVLQPTVMPANRKADVLHEKIQTWLSYSDPMGYFTLTYPSFFTVENRGKIGDIDEVVAFNYTNPTNSVRLTVLRIEIHSKSVSQETKGVEGKDGDGNEVITYAYNVSKQKTLTVVATRIFKSEPDIDFKNVIGQMMPTLTIIR